MNKKGFTLIELLTVIAIIGIIGLIAVPNMIGISDDIKKENMLDDAKKLISQAKAMVSTDYDIRMFRKSGMCNGNDKNICCNQTQSKCDIYFNTLNTNGDIGKDPDNRDYEVSSSYVRYYKSGTLVKYCIHLESEKRIIGENNTCIDESSLFSKSNVKNK